MGLLDESYKYYPKILADKQQKGIERNLLAAMEDMLIQLSSGVPLFTILVNVSASGYGQLSLEFKKAVKKINAGFPQIEVIEELGKKNHSILFRKALWQISNGMKAGSNITEVVRDIIHSLNEEQFLQIQNPVEHRRLHFQMVLHKNLTVLECS